MSKHPTTGYAKGNTVQVYVGFKPTVAAALSRQARREGLTLAALIRRMVDDAMKGKQA